jgi:hypothetical protein
MPSWSSSTLRVVAHGSGGGSLTFPDAPCSHPVSSCSWQWLEVLLVAAIISGSRCCYRPVAKKTNISESKKKTNEHKKTYLVPKQR